MVGSELGVPRVRRFAVPLFYALRTARHACSTLLTFLWCIFDLGIFYYSLCFIDSPAEFVLMPRRCGWSQICSWCINDKKPTRDDKRQKRHRDRVFFFFCIHLREPSHLSKTISCQFDKSLCSAFIFYFFPPHFKALRLPSYGVTRTDYGSFVRLQGRSRCVRRAVRVWIRHHPASRRGSEQNNPATRRVTSTFPPRGWGAIFHTEPLFGKIWALN